MMTFPYIQHQVYGSGRNVRHAGMLHVFRIFYNGGLVTRVTISWIVAGAVVYLIAMYSVFGLGIALQQKSTIAKDLTESNIIAELHLQQRQTEFARSNKDVLQSMHKISDMRYVSPGDTAISRADISPQSNQ